MTTKTVTIEVTAEVESTDGGNRIVINHIIIGGKQMTKSTLEREQRTAGLPPGITLETYICHQLQHTISLDAAALEWEPDEKDTYDYDHDR
jgi:hypothetical protein